MSILHPIFGIGDLVMTAVFVGVVTAVPVSIVVLVIYRINKYRSRKAITSLGITPKALANSAQGSSAARTLGHSESVRPVRG